MNESDTGEPIRQLAGLRESPQPGFKGRVRSSIERRRLTSDLTELSWQGLQLLLLEYIELPFRLLRPEAPESVEPNERGDR